MGQAVKWTRQRVGWALQKSMRVSLCAVRDKGTGRSAHTSDSKWSPWWQLHCLRWLVTPNLVLSYSQIALHMLVSFSLKAEHTSHLWISQLPLSMQKTKRRKEDPRGGTDGQVLIAYHGWHEPVLTVPGTECQRFDRTLTEPNLDITRQKALTRPLEISGIYVFLFLYLEGREIREPSPCGLSTGRWEESGSWSVWVIWAEVFVGLAFQRQNRNAPMHAFECACENVIKGLGW